MRKTLYIISILLLVTAFKVSAQDSPEISRQWGDIDYNGEPWVKNVSRPYKISKGLQNRHISLWASHGRYYNIQQMKWVWQRPNLFCTNEDLFTQTIVTPYLIPMLEKAGAVVFTPRERDWQKNEVVIDNDDNNKYRQYYETNDDNVWLTTDIRGFAMHDSAYSDNENPFEAGTARMTKTTRSKTNCSKVVYQPNFKEGGKYAVYVSYQTLSESIDDAQYIVYHKGQSTEIKVNQQMGGSTWVYIGTFDFDKGCNEYNRVILTNHSSSRGLVTADAVRFGGGMGNIQRGGQTSGLPRCLEGARYYAQWAGMPYNVYSSKQGTDDYGDDINTRSLMTNYLGGGSVYIPSKEGKKVPIELSLAIHSDAGYSSDLNSLIGSLAICTTDFNDCILNSGVSRMMSKDFATMLLNNVQNDITHKYGKWKRRELADRNYSETRLPEVPSVILETMSHQNFSDMIMGQDPNFRFIIARSIYKTITKYIASQHGEKFNIEPLAPDNFRIEFKKNNKIRLSWNEVDDTEESTSRPIGYILYTSAGSSDFDNGTYIKGHNYYDIQLEPNIVYNFKVSAINKGGESFTTEVLSTYYNPLATKTIMIVNGFHRLSSPAIRNDNRQQGFDINADPGVCDGSTLGFCGRQTCFDTSMIGKSGENGLGYSTDELTGRIIAGNTFDYTRTHAEAIAATQNYNIVSCSSFAIESGLVTLNNYAMLDIILGLEKNDGHSMEYYKTFKTSMQDRLSQYVSNGGRLFVSGSYVGSDMQTDKDKAFISNVLKISCDTTELSNKNDTIRGLGNTLTIYRDINEEHYAATSPDVVNPIAPAFCALQYSDYLSAGVAYKGSDYRCFTMGFPFECIKDENTRETIMKGIISYLIK